MQIRHTKVCQSVLETREEVFIAGITFSLTAGRLLPRGSFLDGQARGFSLPKANTVWAIWNLFEEPRSQQEILF